MLIYVFIVDFQLLDIIQHMEWDLGYANTNRLILEMLDTIICTICVFRYRPLKLQDPKGLKNATKINIP